MLTAMDRDSIKSFLALCQKEIPKGNCYLIQRNLNINGRIINTKQALLELGILKEEMVWKYILTLKESECVKVDWDYDIKRRSVNGEIYVFKKIINDKLIYIKLTHRSSGIICISFHESY